MLRILRECDLFRKLPQEHREAEVPESQLSSTCRLFSVVLIAVLLFSEVWNFLAPQSRQRFDIDMDSSTDASAPRQLRVMINVTVHDFPCIDLSLDYQDVMGTRAVDVHTTIFKQRLHANGSLVGETVRNNPKVAFEGSASNPSNKNHTGNHTCGNCYGALPPGECCNTCSDVLYAYRIKRWAVPRIESIEQCKHDPRSSSIYQPPQIIPFSDYSSDDYLPRFARLGSLSGTEARITTPFRANMSLEPLKPLRSIYGGKIFKPLVLNFTGAHLFDFLDDESDVAEKVKPWPECVHRNVIVHGYDFGEALLVDLAAHGATAGCHNNDCKKTDKFQCVSMDICAEVCGKVAACRWWTHGLEEGAAKCWIRTGRHGREKRYSFSSGPQSCSPSANLSTTSTNASTSDAASHLAVKPDAASDLVTTVSPEIMNTSQQASSGSDNSSSSSNSTASAPSRRLLDFEDMYDNFGSQPFTFGTPLHMPMFGTDQREAQLRKEQSGESCQIHGYFDTNKVPGNFHIGTHGPSAPSYLSFIDQPSPPTQNMRHTINKLIFMEVEGGVALNETQSLDSFESPKAFTFQYYITVTPATVLKPNGIARKGYQYRAGSFVTNELIGPAVFFRLDIDPIRVTYYTEEVRWSTFLVNICAVVGGSIALASMLAQFVEIGVACACNKD